MTIKFKKIFLLIFLLGIIIPGMAVAEKWLDKDAEYCITLNLPRKGAPGFYQVDNYAFPFDLKDGFTIWDEKGEKYHFHFDLRKNQLILAAPKKDNTKIYIYPSKKALEKILKNRRYYVADRFIRDWNWGKDQAASQSINTVILSYSPDPKAKQRAENMAKAEAKAKARFIKKMKARARVRAKALGRAKAKADALAKIIAKAKSEAMAKVIVKIQSGAEAKIKAKNIAKVRTEVASIAKIKTKAKTKNIAKVKTEAEIKSEEQARIQAEAKLKSEEQARIQAEAKLLTKARTEAKIKTKAESRAKTQAIIKAKAEARAQAKVIVRIKAESRARDKIKMMKKTINKKNEKDKRRIKNWKYRPRRSPKIGHLPEKDFPADTATLKDIFKYKQYMYRRNNRSTNITRPIYRRLKGKYVAYLDIKLNVPKPGEYQFAVKSNDMVQLYINGKQVLNINKKTASTSKWRETKLLDLSINPVKIEAYYRNSTDQTNIVIGWRAEGEEPYKFTGQKDYVDFNKVEPDFLTSRKGQKLPVIKYTKMGYFQNDKGKQFLLGFETNFSANKIDWQIDGKTVDSGNKIMMTFANKVPENISCVINDMKPSRVIIPESDLKIPGALLKRDLYVKVNAPVFIYDDETLDLSAEFHSELQIDIKALLEAKSNSNIFEDFKLTHAFNKTSNEPLFRSRDFVKKYFKIEGAKLKSGTELEFSIKTSADNVNSESGKFYFDRTKVIFKKLSECSELKTENGYFIDSENNRIIPILHRPNLNDKRSWTLFNSLPSILGRQSTLLIADDFGEEIKFSTQLLNNAKANEQEFIFQDWNLQAFDADIVAENAKKINLIRNSKSAVLIIIPSTYPIMRGISPRLQQRLLAALIQTARDNENINKIILTTPFPLAKIFAENETIETVFENIQHLVTEQEIGFMSLPEFLDDDDNILSHTHPVKKTKEYADVLVKVKNQ
jgi:PA14 domain